MAQTFSDVVLSNTGGESKDAFWHSAELNLLKALVLYVAFEMPPEKRNLAQVSINMCDYPQTPLYRVLEFVRFEAARYGVHVVGTEIIGLAPMMAFVDAADYYLQIEKFDPFKQVLECHLL